jgi:hypothetical protein
MKLLQGAILVLIVAGGWYVAALIKGGPGFFRKQILTENLLRFAGGGDFHEGHLHRFYYMELALFAGFMPWTILLPIIGVEASRAPHPFDSRFKYIFIWTFAALVFFNFPQSKRGVYLLCMYPALATLLAIYIRQAILRPDATRVWVGWISRAAGLVMLLLGSAALVAFAMIVAWPHDFSDLLQAATIRATAFPRMLTTMVTEHWMLALAMPLAVVVLGVRLAVNPTIVERTVLAIAAAMVFITVTVNVIVVPAIAYTLSLRDFTAHAMKVVDGSSVGYLDALNYDVAFYSRRTIPIVWQRDPNLPEYLIAWRTLFDALPASKRSHFEMILESNPTSIDGTDEMILAHQRSGATKPSKPSDGYIEAGNVTTGSLSEFPRSLSPTAAAHSLIRRAG